MERKLYTLTEKQASRPIVAEMPTDEEIKTLAKGRKSWGLLKREIAASALRGTRGFTLGLWQGRVDAARGLDYSEERMSSDYNLGYHDGYLGYESDCKGWDKDTRENFAQYLN